MIRLAERADYPAIDGFLEGMVGIGPRLRVALALVEQNPDIPNHFYIGDAGADGRPGMLLARCQTVSALLGTPGDEAETLAFIRHTGATRLLTNGWCPPGWQASEHRVMLRADDGIPPAPVPKGYIFVRPSVSRAMELLNFESPDQRESYYAGQCARLNRGYAAIVGLEAGGRLASCAFIQGLPGGEAYLYAVQTQPEHRGKGCATALVDHLCRRQMGRVSLLCKPGQAGWYQKLGFEAQPLTALETACPLEETA